MNIFTEYIVKFAYGLVRKRLHQEHEFLGWDEEDSAALDDFLKTASGKKFLGMLGENSNRALQQVMTAKNPDELNNIKAQAKVWQSLRGNMEMLRMKKRDNKIGKLTNDQLEEMFSKMVCNSIKVTRTKLVAR